MYYDPLSIHKDTEVEPFLIFQLGKQRMIYSLLTGIADHQVQVANPGSSIHCLTDSHIQLKCYLISSPEPQSP